jgi:hypothetical protein
MNLHDNDPLHAGINAKLAGILESSSSPPVWHDAWRGLNWQSSEEQRLKVYQAVRDSGLLPAEAGFYLVSWQIDAMTSLETETSLLDLDDRMQTMEKEYELEKGKEWPLDAVPPEYEELLRQHQLAWDRLFVVKLEAFGEQEMADLYRNDPEEFQGRSEAGRQFFHGPEATEA